MSIPTWSNTGFTQNLEIVQGADFPIELHFFANVIDGTPYDLTGCVLSASVKSGVPGANPGVFPFVFTNSAPTTGVISGVLPATVAATMELTSVSGLTSFWWCDIQLADGTIVPFCRGNVTIVM